jgi:pimeloyl-ACP methyl ester carboxylesterase
MEDLVEEVRFFIEEKQLKDPIIIGHSLGGLVASTFAALYPEHIGKLIILSSVDYDSFSNNIFNKMVAFNLRFLNEGCLNPFTIPLITQMLENLVFNKVPTATKYEDIHFTMYHLKIKGMRKALLSLIQNYDMKNFSSTDYKNIKCPTLIIHGNSDRLINYSNGRTLYNNIPKAKLCIIDRGSHMIILENKDEVTKIIEEFIKESD